jgi:hypothetical protein
MIVGNARWDCSNQSQWVVGIDDFGNLGNRNGAAQTKAQTQTHTQAAFTARSLKMYVHVA